MFKSNFWYDNTLVDVISATATFYHDDGKYRGNMYDCKGKIIGDYICDDSMLLQRIFPNVFAF